MIARSTAIRVALLVIGLACGVAPLSVAQAPVVGVGIVLDGPWERNDETLAVFQKEILDLTRPEFDVRFPPDKRLLADFTLASVRAAVDGLLADPDVDLVLTLGPIASAYACRRGSLPKPVIAAFVLHAEVQGIPVNEGADGERVFTFPFTM